MAETVNQHVAQCPAAAPNIVECVIFEIYAIFRAAHGLEHGWESLSPIAQQIHPVSVDRRCPVDGLLDRALHLQIVG
jgi:hypothetical protein